MFMSYNAPPPPPPSQGAATPPPNHLVWAILTTIFCCLPLGVVSIIYAAQVNGKYQSGDVAGAQESSRKAKQWAIWSAVTGVVLSVLWIVLMVVGIAALPETSTTTSY